MAEQKNSGVAFDFQLIGRIIKLARPYKVSFYSSIFLTLILTALAPVRPYLVQVTLDRHVPNKDMEGLVLFSTLILVHILLQTAIMYAHTYLTNLLGQNVIRDLRVRVYRHILSMRKKFFDQSKVGTLVTRAVSDIETVSNVFSQGLISIIGDLAQLLVILVVMFYQDWELTLISLTVFPILLVASEFFRRGVRKSFQQVRTQISKLNAFVQEHIVGMDVVQIFGKQDQEYEKFKEINKGHLDAYKKSIFYYAVYFPVVEILSSVAIGLIIWWSARTIGSDSSPGMIVSFYMYVSMIFRPIRTIADRFNTMQMGMVSSERIFKLLDEDAQLENKGEVTEDVQGDIEFKDVWFAYESDDYVLKGISFKVEQGKSLAIVGATGAGKSSIISLISRLYDIQKGDILIDGKPVKSYDIEALRSQISVVLQDVFLFAGTIRENVQLKNQSISEDQMEQAAREIGALDFVEGLQDSWDYDVKERGSSLSVGQRQLISFIRALAFDPKVLILDEATSSVDSETEELIQNATKRLMKDRTSIVIAHRLSTIREADNILVLDKGVIVEQGTHQELLDKDGYYRELYEKQFELS
ncbi:ABC transporter ATP-binding protein [bacterium]|nr:ABC transporter ATP-binding protein [bacterium]